jgi:hypothetical protein
MPCTIGKKRQILEDSTAACCPKLVLLKRFVNLYILILQLTCFISVQLMPSCITAFEKLIFLVWYMDNSAATTAKLYVCLQPCAPIYIHILCILLLTAQCVYNINHIPFLGAASNPEDWRNYTYMNTKGMTCKKCGSDMCAVQRAWPVRTIKWVEGLVDVQ